MKLHVSAFAVLAFARAAVESPTAEPPLERVIVQAVWAPCRSVASAVLPERRPLRTHGDAGCRYKCTTDFDWNVGCQQPGKYYFLSCCREGEEKKAWIRKV